MMHCSTPSLVDLCISKWGQKDRGDPSEKAEGERSQHKWTETARRTETEMEAETEKERW